MIFREHANKAKGLNDKLNYAFFVDESIIVNKDGALLTSFQYRGKDIQSATTDELDNLSRIFNSMTMLLGDGWMIHVDPIRIESTRYPTQGYFPDPVSAMIDDERRKRYESDGTHFENIHFITFVWKFPIPTIKAAKKWFLEGLDASSDAEGLLPLLTRFKDTIRQCEQLVSNHLTLIQLDNAELLSYLNMCITGELIPVSVPPQGCYLDIALARKPLVGGFVPRIGNKKIYLLSLLGYVNNETMPGILEHLMTYPLCYRWSNRFVTLSQETADAFIKRYKKNWSNKVKGITGLIGEAITGRESRNQDNDAAMMRDEVETAIILNNNNSARFGFWTSTLVLMHEDQTVLENALNEIEKYLMQAGFSVLLETINAVDAWFGTLPGHGHANLRNLFIPSTTLSHFLPLHDIWAGEAYSHPSSLLPKGLPPAFYARATGMTPFRYHTDVMDLGHQLFIGPSGAGKSTIVDLLITQFLRYENAQVFVFDKDHSHQALIKAMNSHYYDIGNQAELAFCPLAKLDTDEDKLQAATFIEQLVALQGMPIDTAIRTSIFDAINALASDQDSDDRTLTVFRSTVQNENVRSALKYYTVSGQFKLLDSNRDNLKTGAVQGFEMGWLLSQKPEIFLPVLLYLFQQIERRLQQGDNATISKPALIILEEAWLYIAHPVFAAKLRDWLKTLRKFNARVVFVTQSLADLIDPSTGLLTQVSTAILESCPVKVYLPNQDTSPLIRKLYALMGLNERQIHIITQESIPKKHYYVVTPMGNRLIDLGLEPGSIALKFLGLSKAKSAELLQCKKSYGEDWLRHWTKSESEVQICV